MSEDKDKIQDQVSGDGWRSAGAGGGAFTGGGTLFTEPILVVNQKAKIIELSNQYAVYDQNGNQIAQVNQVGQSW
ncbi:MAG: scramblase, partial [Actinomycetota bacterium]